MVSKNTICLWYEGGAWDAAKKRPGAAGDLDAMQCFCR